MNNTRRKELTKLSDRIIEIKDCLEAILNDEENYKDNVPENLQGSEAYENSENACDTLYTAVGNLEDVAYSIIDV